MAVELRLFRALAVLRVVVLANMVGLNVYRFGNYEHPWLGMGIVALLAVWTGVAIWASARPRPWLSTMLVLELALAVTALASTPLVKGEGWRATIPGFWVMTVVLAWAVHWRWRGGLVAAGAIAVTETVIRTEITQTTYGHLFLLLIGGPIVGYMCQSLQLMAAERDAAERAAAAAGERARLARAVHDGVLQVLALMQRRGREAGGDLAELGRLAAEQESALRSLIHQQDVLRGPSSSEETDLAAGLEALGRRTPLQVTVVTPGAEVVLPSESVEELLAVVGECLANVVRHVGPQAPAWVVLEEAGSEVILSVRDEGPGIPAGRLEQAAADGRLGVTQSICGRIADLGGRADLDTGPHGTEWEFTLPR